MISDYYNRQIYKGIPKRGRAMSQEVITDWDGFSREYDKDGSGCDVTADHLNEADDEADDERHRR